MEIAATSKPNRIVASGEKGKSGQLALQPHIAAARSPVVAHLVGQVAHQYLQQIVDVRRAPQR